MKLRIEKAIYGGSGLAHVPPDEGALAGKTVFVPFTLPGELMNARVVEDKRSFVIAEMESVIEPALGRTTPACPYFATCGGCSYQHAVYAHQVEMKTAILREALERAHIPSLPPIHALHGQPWHYRNRIRLLVQRDPFALCYRERRSHTPLPVRECPIASPLLEKAITAVTDSGGTSSKGNLCSEIEFFAASGDASLLMSLWTGHAGRDASGDLKRICESLRERLPQISGAALFAAEPRKVAAQLRAQWGEPQLTYDVGGFGYRVSAGSFFQVNRFVVDALVDLVTANRSGGLAWDLYAGVGLFSRALSQRFQQVVAVESARESLADLRHNLNRTAHNIVGETTASFLRRRAGSPQVPDLAVVDPPRTGLGAEVVSLLARCSPATIVYVSCDPATLARDLQALIQSGYDLQTITMVDMFPQTFHLESVSVLMRR